MPGNENLSPFMQRLARAHANCLEDLPIFGGLLLVSLVLDKITFTDGLALWFLGARIIQSSIHLISTSESNGIYSHCLRAATSDVSPLAKSALALSPGDGTPNQEDLVNLLASHDSESTKQLRSLTLDLSAFSHENRPSTMRRKADPRE